MRLSGKWKILGIRKMENLGLDSRFNHLTHFAFVHRKILCFPAEPAGNLCAGFPGLESFDGIHRTNRLRSIAGSISGLIGFLLGIPILRLKGFYIAMATLAFGVVISEIILQWSSVTGGDDGFSVPTARIGSFVFDSDFKLFYLIIPVTIIMTLLAKNLVNGYIGRAFIALRESEVAAQTIGVDIAKYKTIAFAISAFYTGVAGGLFAYLITFLSPDAFTIELSIDFIAMIVIGGMGSILGSIIGAVILTGIQQVLAGLLDLQILIFGLSLIIFMIFMPRGIVGMLADLKERFN
jgi:branched-chain amino acid transport system permease protein